MRLFPSFCLGVAALGCPFLACSNGEVTYGVPPGTDGGIVGVDAAISGEGVGKACDAVNMCRAGLACTMGTCSPSHASSDGAPCTISDECKQGDYCTILRTCAPGGASTTGGACKSDGDCAAGLRCSIVGLGTECDAEGKGDVGAACAAGTDCFGGLSCINKACGTYPPPGLPPQWAGETCADDPGQTAAYFRVPRGSNDGDFYRLPFPNDVRLKNGHPDLSGHPSPGSSLLGFDVVDRYLRDVEKSTDGFSTYPTVFFRFSGPVSFESLKLDGAIKWYDVTPGRPPQEVGFGWSATTARNAYLCANAVKIRPPEGAPLAPGHTYAVILSTRVVDANQQAIKRADDLVALLAASAPADPVLAAAYAAYKPLRGFATAKPLDTTQILDAAMFTVGHATELASNTALAVGKVAAPAATKWIKCGVGTSPCPQTDGTRACPATPDPAFDELHAMVTLPIFQQGNAPYLTPNDGGDFTLAADGLPNVQRTEQVCLSLTVPKGEAMPASGWPLVIYAHGTGGSFRSAINDGVAARLANIDDGSGTVVHAAVLGIDQVEHGPRRGGSNASPNNLFYNFANPSAARGNPMQGAADQIALARFASNFDLTAANSPTSAEIKFGTMAFWGHSQGATEGGIAMSYDATVHGLVLSGQGASLIDALLSKKSPVDVADAVPIALQDSAVDIYHPVLAILQNAIDVADPLNHAFTLSAGPVVPTTAKHLFQPFGTGDSYAPPETEKTFALAGALGVAASPAGVTPVVITDMPLAIPAGGNVLVGGIAYTTIVREYSPDATYDGHFVSFKEPNAVRDVDRFLYDVLTGAVPKIGR